ncbi:MAG: outer membrane beta-barrel protein [Chitinophagaceae bacterium]|jgi:hypothetical protein|nr:outer membrane beta-barrel protein [Chitinophagaceae bacterium]
MKKLFLILLTTCSIAATAQQKRNPVHHQYADFSATIGASQQSLAASYNYNWKLGKSRKFELGLGVRNTTYFGVKKDFWTADARLARTNTTPFLIFFAGQKIENWDTLTIQRPFTNSLNISLNLGYNISKKLYAGFNIDAIGFTFGRTTSGILKSNGTTRTEPAAKPAAFNLLLTGDHDLGSLNSEFHLNYNINDHWSIKGIYQFLFVEYKTTTIQQTAPDGTKNDRFRNKANNGGLGVVYHF